MKLIVYDFDKTIYSKETTVEFTKYILKKEKKYIFKFFIAFIKSIFYFKNLKLAKEKYYSFLNGMEMKKINNYINEFWHIEYTNFFKKILEEIEKNKKTNEKIVIISASPEFILKPIKEILGIDNIIGTKFQIDDIFISNVISNNCKGKYKVDELKKIYEDFEIINFYSDSISDKPLYDLSKNKYYIDKNGNINEGMPVKKRWLDKLL